jgi:hypothetical protein
MPTKKLTDLFVERVKGPSRGRVEYFDAAFPGLALRVTDHGRKSWSLHYRMHGRLRRFTLGSYPAIKPAQARREAADALGRARQGVDPSAEKQARRLARSPETETFGAVRATILITTCAPTWRQRPTKKRSASLKAMGFLNGIIDPYRALRGATVRLTPRGSTLMLQYQRRDVPPRGRPALQHDPLHLLGHSVARIHRHGRRHRARA